MVHKTEGFFGKIVNIAEQTVKLNGNVLTSQFAGMANLLALAIAADKRGRPDFASFVNAFLETALVFTHTFQKPQH